jgi:primosomal replication protein N
VALNAVALSGELAEIEPLRHTPAGIPLLRFKLAHRSQQIEAGYKRQVECEVSGVAVGETAMSMSRMQAGQAVIVEGFLNRKSAQIILHVTKAQTLKDTDHAKTGTEQGQSQG